ncbi:MAG TPA: hypothetical protein DCR40_01525 [Prolixibacteraceae bacterium]|nr:hypothetical protein [Prolixibacteraceae bacterium]
MKTSMKSLVISSFFIISLFVSSSCQKDDMNAENVRYASVLSVSEDGTTSVIEANLKSALIETSDLTESELASLLKMKVEEKFARDVYAVLAQKWGSQIFSNIAKAENNHLNAIILLLTKYGSTEPSMDEAGIFADATIQKLYNDLVAKASISIEEAYKTGALIEEMDIKDLTVALSGTTNENIALVFENLLKGSRNHLRAFNLKLINLGLTYIPIFISQDEYTQIATSAMEKGKQYRMNDQGNGQGNGKGKAGKGRGSKGNGTCNI